MGQLLKDTSVTNPLHLILLPKDKIREDKRGLVWNCSNHERLSQLYWYRNCPCMWCIKGDEIARLRALVVAVRGHDRFSVLMLGL